MIFERGDFLGKSPLFCFFSLLGQKGHYNRGCIEMNSGVPMTKLALDENIVRLYAPSARFVSTVEVPELKFLMLDGTIEEGENLKTSEGFQAALNVLSGISFTLNMAIIIEITIKPTTIPITRIMAGSRMLTSLLIVSRDAFS